MFVRWPPCEVASLEGTAWPPGHIGSAGEPGSHRREILEDPSAQGSCADLEAGGQLLLAAVLSHAWEQRPPRSPERFSVAASMRERFGVGGENMLLSEAKAMALSRLRNDSSVPSLET